MKSRIDGSCFSFGTHIFLSTVRRTLSSTCVVFNWLSLIFFQYVIFSRLLLECACSRFFVGDTADDSSASFSNMSVDEVECSSSELDDDESTLRCMVFRTGTADVSVGLLSLLDVGSCSSSDVDDEKCTALPDIVFATKTDDGSVGVLSVSNMSIDGLVGSSSGVDDDERTLRCIVSRTGTADASVELLSLLDVSSCASSDVDDEKRTALRDTVFATNTADGSIDEAKK